MREQVRLASKDDWVRDWGRHKIKRLVFRPRTPHFRDLHRLFQRVLPHKPGLEFLEIGCYPGRFLLYFHSCFGYKVTGIDYLEEACKHTQELLAAEGVKAEVINADLFDFAPHNGKQWDVVASFGFVEHFSHPSDVVRKHLDLLKPAGMLALTIPNHSGLNGRILKKVDPEKCARHNYMSCEELVAALVSAGEVDVIKAGYFGQLGFWNAGLFPKIRSYGRPAYVAARTLHELVAYAAGVLPNTSFFSPSIAVVARKKC